MRRPSAAVAAWIVMLATVPTPAVAVETSGDSRAVEAADWASVTRGDPWDYRDDGDVLTDGGGAAAPVGGAEEATVVDGHVIWRATDSSHLSPLYFTVPGALPELHDGPARPVDADTFTHASLRLHADIDRTTTASIRWFGCRTFDQSVCMGGDQFTIKPGWNTVVLGRLDNDYASVGLPSAWEGTIHGVRLAVDGGGRFRLDWLRLYDPGSAEATWTVSDADGLSWRGSDDDGSDTDDVGLLHVDADARIGSGAFPPGRHIFTAADGESTGPLEVTPRPTPVILDPDATGGADYATTELGDAWNFDDPGDVSALANAGDVVWDEDRLCATNTSNDPWFTLPLAPGGIDSSRYHRLTLRMTIDGAFDLADAPGGGAHARLLFKTPSTAGGTEWIDSRELLTLPHRGTSTYLLEATPGAARLAEDSSPSMPPDWTGAVTALRMDPSEDPSGRRWCVDDIRLTADDEARETFRVTWRDHRHEDGTTVTLSGRHPSGRRTTFIPPPGTPQAAGVNGVTIDVRGLLPGLWELGLEGHHGGVRTAVTASGPLRVPPRLAGRTRTETAIALSRNAFPRGADGVVVATATDFPDALAAAPLADATAGPVLLNPADRLDGAVAAEVHRLSPQVIHLLGGHAAQSRAVEASLRGLADRLGARVERVAGADRFGTAAEAARRATALWGDSRGDAVLLATAGGFADALSAGTLAAHDDLPLLLVRRDAVPAATAKAIADLDPAEVVVVGGSAALTERTVRDAAAGRPTLRLAGSDRYATAVAVRDAAVAVGAEEGVVMVASGEGFPDALAAGPAVAARGGGLLLVGPEALPAPTRRALGVAAAELSWLRIAGGRGAVVAAVVDAVLQEAGVSG